MSKKTDKNINLYVAYQEATREKRGSSKGLLAVIPLILLLAALGGVYVYESRLNAQKTATLDGINAQIAGIEDEYNEVLGLVNESAILTEQVIALQTDADFALMYPLLDADLFVQVNACAGETFNISVFRYDEDSATLEIDASAPSVNDMPELVEALRRTGLFRSVQYVGYTSDTDGVYYCTIGCVLMPQEVEVYE